MVQYSNPQSIGLNSDPGGSTVPRLQLSCIFYIETTHEARHRSGSRARAHNTHDCKIGARHSQRVSGAVLNLILGHPGVSGFAPRNVECPVSRRELRNAKCEMSEMRNVRNAKHAKCVPVQRRTVTGRLSWFSQSWLTKRGVPRRDRELLKNRPIIFLALRPRSRVGGRGGSAKISPKVTDSNWR